MGLALANAAHPEQRVGGLCRLAVAELNRLQVDALTNGVTRGERKDIQTVVGVRIREIKAPELTVT